MAACGAKTAGGSSPSSESGRGSLTPPSGPLVSLTPALQADLLLPERPKRWGPGKWKGKLMEKLTDLYLRAEGYLPHMAQDTGVNRGGMWIAQSNDVFGCFDCVAWKKGARDLCAQITTEPSLSHKKAKIEPVLPFVDVERKDVDIWLSFHVPKTTRTGTDTVWVEVLRWGGAYYRKVEPIVFPFPLVREVEGRD